MNVWSDYVRALILCVLMNERFECSAEVIGLLYMDIVRVKIFCPLMPRIELEGVARSSKFGEKI